MVDSIDAVFSASAALKNESLVEASLTNPINNQSRVGSNAFLDSVAQLDATIKAADNKMNTYMLEPNSVELHDLMITMEKAKLSMQVAVEVRNRLVEVYKSITSMQV